MRIVIDATAAVSGGKVYLRQLLEQFARLEGTDLFTIFHTGDFDDFRLPEGAARFEFVRVRVPATFGWVSSSVAKMLWRLLVLPRRLKRIAPDLLFSNSGFGAGRRVDGVRTVLAIHNSMPLRPELIREEKSIPGRLRLLLLNRLIRKALAECDSSIVFSHDTRNRMVENFGESGLKTSVIYHGVDWSGEEVAATGTDVPQPLTDARSSYILYVSQFHRYKNVIRLIDAFALVASRFPSLKLLLVGDAPDARYWKDVTASIRNHKLDGRIIHIPALPRHRLVSIYRGAMAFAHPSLAETCSLPLLEALALGVPIAAANCSALPEMAGDAALYFDPRDPADIADKLNLILSNDDLRASLSHKAVIRAQDFSWESSARQTLNLFHKLSRH